MCGIVISCELLIRRIVVGRTYNKECWGKSPKKITRIENVRHANDNIDSMTL